MSGLNKNDNYAGDFLGRITIFCYNGVCCTALFLRKMELLAINVDVISWKA
jgi:hypothetical protein